MDIDLYGLLTRMMERQRESIQCFLHAEKAKATNDFPAATEAYDGSIAAGREHLEMTLLYNQGAGGQMDIVPIVQSLLNVMFMQADLRQAQGLLAEANRLRAEALVLGRTYLSERGRAEMERSHGATLIAQGRFNEALVALSAARDLFQSDEDAIMMARATLDMVHILQWLGDGVRALRELRRAADLIAPRLREGGTTTEDVDRELGRAIRAITAGGGDESRAQETAQLRRIWMELRYYEGLINKLIGNFDEAERQFRLVLTAYQELGSGPAIEYQLAALHVRQGRHQEGLAALEALEPFFVSGGLLRPKLAALRCLQGEALLLMDSPDEALRRLTEADEDLLTFYDPEVEWKVSRLRGKALAATSRPEEALQAYWEASAKIETLRKAPLGHRLDSTYLEDKLPLFQDAITLAHDLGRADDCCQLMEMIKSRLLTTTLSIPRNSSDEADANLDRRIDELTRTLDVLEYTGYREGWTPEVRLQREVLLEERAALLERARFSDPRWRSMTQPMPFDLRRVKAALRERQQADLNLFYLPPLVIVALLDDAGSAVSSVRLTSTAISRLAAYGANLRAARPDPTWFDISVGLSIEGQDLLPADLLARALHARQLIVVPNGSLHLVCWAGLIFQGKRLFEYCPVGILPNLSCLLSLDASFSVDSQVALIGAPTSDALETFNQLHYAKAEIEEIGATYSSAGRLMTAPLVGPQATGAGFWRLADHPEARGGTLHIACHATFEEAEPMNSGLLLSDSKVDAAEIARASLPYGETILSGCETGHRPTQVKDIELSGDDILGLPAAFLEAGVRSVLVSIPKADDGASYEFMVRYHGNRLDGTMPLTALQRTQKEMLRYGVYPPYWWIGFSMYGCR